MQTGNNAIAVCELENLVMNRLIKTIKACTMQDLFLLGLCMLLVILVVIFMWLFYEIQSAIIS